MVTIESSVTLLALSLLFLGSLASIVDYPSMPKDLTTPYRPWLAINGPNGERDLRVVRK